MAGIAKSLRCKALDIMDAIRFYFSFRSPYAWLATERLEEELASLAPIEILPVFPTPGLFPNDPTGVPNKVSHLIQDVIRLTRERNLPLEFPSVADPDWALSHAAALGAKAIDGGLKFALETFRSRWSQGLDLGRDDVIGDAAERAGYDREAIVAAAHDPSLRDQATEAFRMGVENDKLFGVPTFIYKGQLYWGQDRMRFVRAAVAKATNAP